MERFLVENMDMDNGKEKNKIVLGADLLDGVYIYDRDYVEVGNIITTKSYESGIRVLELDTGDRVVEVRVEHGENGGKCEYIRLV